MSVEKLKRQIQELKQELQVKEDVKNLIIRQVEKRAESAEKQIADLKEKLDKYEKQFGHAILNCIAGKMRKTKKGNYVIPLIDICNQEYGKVVLEDDFNVDLKSVVNVALDSNLGKSIEAEQAEGRLSAIQKYVKEKSEDWHHSYETLGHSYQMFLAEAIGVIEELEGLVGEEAKKCPIEGVSKDCEKCDGKSTTWKENGETKECLYVTVWKARQKPSKSSPYKPLEVGEEQ